MGKLFLIKDATKPIKWKLSKETKHIGKYQCYKATYTKMVEKPKTMSFTMNGGKMEKEESEGGMEEITVTAWYTTDIPVSNGPEEYQGLPGLILEVHDRRLNIVCSKIVLNPKGKFKIEEPKRGKKITQKEYDDMMMDNMKKMMDNMGRGQKGGTTFSIGG